MTPDEYFETIEAELATAVERAETARDRGEDPTDTVEIPVAVDMADRVENILGIEGVADRVRELEDEMSREEAALRLVEDFVDGSVGDYDTPAGTIEGAVRTAVALLTEGVVAAPIEGIDRVEVRDNDDGSSFVAVYYAGPIRSAGGTAQALSVLAADYARALLGLDAYHPREEEIERYVEEVGLYDDETGLQYSPKDAETRYIAEHCPVMLDGEATGQEEVSGYRDLERVDTNNPRGGLCLVLAEGLALKAPKIQRYTRDLDAIDWPWLEDLISGELGADDDEAAVTTPVDDTATATEDGRPRPEPSKKYLRDLIAGRPVFGHPSTPGGFRLRYGRARNHGFATAGVHPATMYILDDFLATGTQLKTERPGKAAGVVPVDSIDGPTVRLANGDVRRIDDVATAKELQNGVEAVLDLGEYLVNYGEFVENNQPLAPAAYTVEWWLQDMAASGATIQALRDSPHVDIHDPTPDQALAWARDHDAPLHPAYTYLWHDLTVDQFHTLADAVTAGTSDDETLTLDHSPELATTLETLLVEHHQSTATIEIPDWRPLAVSLGLDPDTREPTWETLPDAVTEGDDALDAVNHVAPITIQARAPTRVGARMGRPEKSEQRELNPAVHTLFPIGDAGGSQRNVNDATDAGQITVELGNRECPDCGTHTFRPRCPDCRTRTDPYFECPDCDVQAEPGDGGRVACPRCDRELDGVRHQEVALDDIVQSAHDAVGERGSAYDILKGVKGLTSQRKVPEPIEKGILRAKHDVSAFKDGTVRYDMTDLPVTTVRPQELSVTVDQFRELGYDTDIHGDRLRHDDQLVELKVQDIVLSDGAADHLLRTADFVDDLLTAYYDLDPYYEADERDDLVGELVFGLAPHTSAAVVGRVVGFTSAAVGYAHPYFHAAKRRNCFHPDTKFWFEDRYGKTHLGQIDEFVEQRLDPNKATEDDFGALVQTLDGNVRVPSLTPDGETTWKPIEAISKHPAPDHMVRIETRSGQQLTVTPDHSMLRWNDDEIERIKAHELAVGDIALSPKEIEFEGTTVTLDLLDEFTRIDAVPNEELMLRGIGSDAIKRLLAEATDSDTSLKSTAERHELSQSTVYNWISRNSVPASVLVELLGRSEMLERVPEDVKLGVRRDSISINRCLEVTDGVAGLLGYYAAEGFTRRESGSWYQTTICTPDDEAREYVIQAYANHLGVSAFEENKWKVTVSSRLVSILFSDILAVGERAETKRIPDVVLSAPSNVLSSFLAAYFSGDGTTSRNRVEIRAQPVSDELLEDLVAVLKRFGIATKSYQETRKVQKRSVSEFYDGNSPTFETNVLKITSENAMRFADAVGFHLDRNSETLEEVIESTETRSQRLFGDGGNTWLDEITDVTIVGAETEYTYSVTVSDTNTLIVNDLYSGQCDGDEDCVMLLMDGLLNFSKQYLPDARGGRMDAPLVMSSRIDPAEIDDEAHNIDVVGSYPRAFFEATRRMADPDEVDVTLAAESVGTEDQYAGFGFTHDTSDIALGPDLSAYKTLGSMTEKMDAQLELARKVRAVDESDVAERVIESHFLPDLMGNLRAFSRQETRCLDCGRKYRRMPLTGECRECGGSVNLTVHEGSVSKYMDTALEVAEEYGAREYTRQRLEILDRTLESLFVNDKNRQSGIADFM
ncbi:MAG: DNA polymerase II large subunit [Halobacteriaceae archaeon]